MRQRRSNPARTTIVVLAALLASVVTPCRGLAGTDDSLGNLSNRGRVKPPTVDDLQRQRDSKLDATSRPDSGISFAPTIIDITVRPGVTLVKPILLTARGDKPITVEYSHSDFGFTKSYTVRLIRDTERETVPFSTRGWFSVPRTRIVLPPGKQTTIPLTIRVPSTISPETHLGAALFRTVPDAASPSSSGFLTSTETGPLVLIRVRGGQRPRPKLERIEIPRYRSRGPIPVSFYVNNSGRTHLRFKGRVRMTGRGPNEGTGIRSQVVLPNAPRQVHASVGRNNMPLGVYRVEVEIISTPGQIRVREHHWVIVAPAWLRALLALFGIGAIGIGVAGATVLVVRHRRANRPRVMVATGDEHDPSIDDRSEDGTGAGIVDEEPIDETARDSSHDITDGMDDQTVLEAEVIDTMLMLLEDHDLDDYPEFSADE